MVGAHRRIDVLLPDTSALLDIYELAADVAFDPIEAFAAELLVIVARNEVVYVLGIWIRNPVTPGCERCLGIGRVALDHAAGLPEELPRIPAATRLFLDERVMDPVVAVGRVGAHPQAAPGALDIRRGRVAPYAGGDRRCDNFRDLAALVYKTAG